MLLLELPGLKITAEPAPGQGDWFDCLVKLSDASFHGEVQTIFTDQDLADFARQLDRLQAPCTVTLGGGRAAELRLEVEAQQGGEPGMLALECSLTPSGDDPYPSLTILQFDVKPEFAATTAERIRELMG